MPKKSIDPRNVYEIMENDDGEIMILLYAGDTAPQNSTFRINIQKKNLELFRSATDTVIIDGLTAESIEKLKNTDKLYVCEMKYNENPNSENEIVYAYTTTPLPQTKKTEVKESSISDKAKKAREKILKKA